MLILNNEFIKNINDNYSNNFGQEYMRIFYFQYNDFNVCQKGNTKLWFYP